MILTDHTITAEINNGNIVVEPFIPENLGTNSIDLTLSNTFTMNGNNETHWIVTDGNNYFLIAAK